MAIRKDLTTEDLIPWMGNHHTIRVTLDTNGSISGWTLGFLLKKYRDDADDDAMVTQATSGVTQTINDAGSASTVGVIDTSVSKALTETLEHNHEYWYAILRTDAGSETTLVHGVWPSKWS